jgi:hypothetical protein
MKLQQHEFKPPLQNHPGVCVRRWACDAKVASNTRHDAHFYNLKACGAPGSVNARVFCDGRLFSETGHLDGAWKG